MMMELDDGMGDIIRKADHQDDGMGDIIRQAAPPSPGEGSYKKVKGQKRDRKEPLCGTRRECCPNPAHSSGIGELEKGKSAEFKVLAQGKACSLLVSLSPDDKISGGVPKGVLPPGNTLGF